MLNAAIIRRLLLAGVCLLLPDCSGVTTRDVLATVLSVEGTITISSDGGRNFLPLLSGAHPAANALIQTSASSRVAMALLPSILVQLDHDTRLEIIRISLTKDGNETGEAMRGRYAVVRLLAGRMFASQTWGEASSGFTVVTPHGELVTTSNSLYCLESDEHKTRVTCVSGMVRFQPHDGAAAIAVRGGFFVEWPSSTPGPIAAETDARGQEDLLEALGVEQKLRRLMNRNP